MATSDLHAHLSPWDYYRDRANEGSGLAHVAGLVRAARAEAENCLFFDNGDLIEGGPLADFAFQAEREGDDREHPMIAALNALGCDAATLGNHEFSYGLAFLQKVMAQAGYPVLSANILAEKGETIAEDRVLYAPWALLDRSYRDVAGGVHHLRIGVLGLTPPHVLHWDRVQLSQAVDARAMVQTAAHYVPLIRAEGADIVVVLAHCGIGDKNTPIAEENVGIHLASLPGIDALVLGHEHKVFPAAADQGEGADKLAGVPVVMPGAFGSHLGVIDLDLTRNAHGWQINQARAQCRAVSIREGSRDARALVVPDPALLALAHDSHQATRDMLSRPVGTSDVALHSYFSIAKPSAKQALIAAAQATQLAEMMQGTAFESLPILSAVAPFKTGGRGGPDYFSDVPEGVLLMRHVADMYLYPNRFAALVLDGRGLRDWLERSATAYALVGAGLQDQPLLHPSFPATALEMIAGLTYCIDLSAPACYDAPTGQRTVRRTGQAGRIRDLRYQGKPVTDQMRFALATNSHRLGVMMGLPGQQPLEIIADGTSTPTSRDILLRYLAQGDTMPPPKLDWGFCPLPNTSVILETSPNAVAHVAELAHFAPKNLGLTAAGFLRFRLHL